MKRATYLVFCLALLGACERTEIGQGAEEGKAARQAASR
jgi:hypothetical protein